MKKEFLSTNNVKYVLVLSLRHQALREWQQKEICTVRNTWPVHIETNVSREMNFVIFDINREEEILNRQLRYLFLNYDVLEFCNIT